MKVKNLMNNAYIKKVIITILLSAIPATVTLSAGAAGEERQTPRYTDAVGLLTAQQVEALTAKLDEISARWEFDTVITVTDTTGYKNPRIWAADFYEAYGFGYGDELDGIILMLSMQERDFAFVTTGYGNYAFTSAGQEYLEKQFLPHLKNDDYYAAFMAFAGGVDDFLAKAGSGSRYTDGNIPMTPAERRDAHIWSAVISIIVALIIPWIAVTVWTNQLRTVRPKDTAADYVRYGSLNLSVQRDIFLYRRISKVPRAQSTGGGGGKGGFSSSSGRSFSGRSGKF